MLLRDLESSAASSVNPGLLAWRKLLPRIEKPLGTESREESLIVPATGLWKESVTTECSKDPPEMQLPTRQSHGIYKRYLSPMLRTVKGMLVRNESL